MDYATLTRPSTHPTATVLQLEQIWSRGLYTAQGHPAHFSGINPVTVKTILN